nr:hypothetical protein [Klebsiella pneumoniae]
MTWRRGHHHQDPHSQPVSETGRRPPAGRGTACPAVA